MGNTVTICFANNKGGSGKSTSCSNVGAALAGMGKKVLMVDGDMQLNLSLSFFSEEEVLEMAAGEKNLYYAIGHQSDLSDFIVHTKYENLDLVPSSTLMSSVEYELFTKWQREFILRKCLQKVKDSGVFGLANMFDFLNEVREIAPDLKVLGIVVTKADARKNYFKQTMETLKEMEGIYLFESFIRVDSSIEWSQDSSEPVVEFKKSSRSAKEYIALAEEVMNRVSR